MTIVLTGRVIKAGRACGRALVSPAPIGFLCGVDPQTGLIREPGHPLEGQSLAGRVLVFPYGKGSTVGSYVIYSLACNGVAPAGMLLAECEPIVALGAIMAGIPTLDKLDIAQVQSGDWVCIEGDRIEVERG